MSAAAQTGLAVDNAVLTEALQAAAARCGRLSDDDVRALRQRRRRGAVATLVAAGVASGLVVGVPAWRSEPVVAQPWTRMLATRAGQHGLATLADGTTVRLNGGTRVRIVYSDGRRLAQLYAGQAFFDVRHDSSRPFVVRAASSQVRVLGTAFDLDLTLGQIALAVYRGAVGFVPVGKPRGVVVRAGFRSSISGGMVAAPSPFDPTQPDWRQGWIDTAGMRLDDLVEVLDRQGKVRIVRPKEPLASTRVFGRFRTDSPRQLLGAIGSGFGFSVVERHGELTLMPTG